jgi:preprotein translocase subunit SecE
METSLVSQQRNVSKRIRAEIARVDWPKKNKQNKRIKERKKENKGIDLLC